MIELYKKVLLPVFALQEFTSAPRVDVTGEIDVSAYEEVVVGIRLGRLTASGFTAGVEFRIEVSPDLEGNRWLDIATYVSALGSSVADQAVNGTCAADQNVIAMASTTGFVVNDIVYSDNGTVANSEFGRIKAVSANVSVTLEHNLENAQTGATVYDQAEFYTCFVDARGINRLLVTVDGSGAGQNFAAEAAIVQMR